MTASSTSMATARCSHSKGFTLIELLIVLSILAIVMAFAVPAYGNYVQRGKITGAVAELREFAQRMDQRYADNRTFDDGNGRCALPNYNDDETDFMYRCRSLDNGQRFLIWAIGRNSMQGFLYRMDESGLERTDRVPAGWTSARVPANRFILRPE